MICENEPTQCKDPKTFTVTDCGLSTLVPFYCPLLCGKCQATKATTTTLTTLSSCQVKSCINGGKFNQKTCLCECNYLSNNIIFRFKGFIAFKKAIQLILVQLVKFACAIWQIQKPVVTFLCQIASILPFFIFVQRKLKTKKLYSN